MLLSKGVIEAHENCAPRNVTIPREMISVCIPCSYLILLLNVSCCVQSPTNATKNSFDFDLIKNFDVDSNQV